MTPLVRTSTTAPSPHPRRPPAHRSVSLLHGSRQKPSPLHERSDSSSDGQMPAPQRSANKSNNPRGPNLKTLTRDSSGESSNAEQWFEQSNNEVRDNRASFTANDPPFFMRNSSSSVTPPDAQRPPRSFNIPPDGSTSLPMRTGLLQLGTDGSSTEDFRSVIDDLTIENKKLKRKLRRFDTLRGSHLRDEQLFEVRVHGLPPEKKRELEETLRKFAASLGTNGFHPDGYEGLLPVLNNNNNNNNSLHHHSKATSSQASLHHPDSAYASMSASGQGSSTQSGHEPMHKSRFASAAARRQNIHSYLHHIPEALLLHPNPETMSETAKKKLVLRRLEQIFAGKGAGAGTHQHPMQQQEISHLAARENRSLGDVHGQRARTEGKREANIMLREVEDPADPATKQDHDISPDEQRWSGDGPSMTGKGVALPRSASQGDGGEDDVTPLEQRPTRPLDVDPHRAQVAADNMHYIRHLGFSPLGINSGPPAAEDRGWIYLNLLINMAQLHTINVTADFVRKALTEYHSELELSHDGRKVRWKGGRSMTTTSSSGDGSSNHYVGMYTPDGESPRKRPRLSRRKSSRLTTQSARQGAASAKSADHHKLMYTPLFSRRSSIDSDDSSEDEDEDEDQEYNLMNSPNVAPAAGNSSGMTSSGVRTVSTKKNKRRDDGPIIFYNNARFCTDLSGDHTPLGNRNSPPYVAISSVPLGKQPPHAIDTLAEKRGPLAKASRLPEPMRLSDNPIPESMELVMPPQSPQDPSDRVPMRPIELEVCGIGGVWPSDNFAIAVHSQHAAVDSKAAPEVEAPPIRWNSLPPKFQQLLREHTPARKAPSAVHGRHIMSVQHKSLPPSALPPALGFMPFDDPNDDEESDVDDEMSNCPESTGAFPPSAAPQPMELHYASSEEDEDDNDSGASDAESDSLDLLATAREIDPDAIRAKEREYDANMAERLAEEIPAGSSAATAGGGSGYASPASGMNREEYQRALKEARARSEIFPRAKTSDSMVVQVQGGQASLDEEGDEMSDVAS